MLTCTGSFAEKLCRTLSLSNYLMVACKTILKTRKWALFYMKKDKIDRSKNAVKQGNALKRTRSLRRYSVSKSQTGWGSNACHGGRDWHWTCEDALVTIHHDDNLVLDIEHATQTMEGDSVTAAINTNHLSLEGSSHWAVNTKNDQDNMSSADKMFDCKHLEEVKIPSKTWDIIVSHRSKSHSEGGANPSDGRATMSGQGEE